MHFESSERLLAEAKGWLLKSDIKSCSFIGLKIQFRTEQRYVEIPGGRFSAIAVLPLITFGRCADKCNRLPPKGDIVLPSPIAPCEMVLIFFLCH